MSEVKRSVMEEKEIVEVETSASCILNDPLLNKGCAFTEEERTLLGLHGLLPYHISTIEEQSSQRYANFKEKQSHIEKYTFLSDLQNLNETLFYHLCSQHPEEMLPYIYTPTVGEACSRFSQLYSHQRGLYLSYPHRERIEEMVANIPRKQLDVVVITDGARILGLGDLGMGGMGIPIGKLSLYTLFGGIHPGRTLPITLDVGTNNKNLLSDPLYLGWHHERITGEAYASFIDRVVTALTKRFPDLLIQWEDFAKDQAQPLLDRYRNQICCFNDDIQGTAGVVVAGLLAALRGMDADLKEQRFLFFGAGSAGIGVAELLTQAMMEQGMAREEAKERIYVMGRKGIAHSGVPGLDDLKKRFAQKEERLEGWQVENREEISLIEAVRHVRPTILIGTSTQPSAFNEEVVTEMKKHAPRPIIFPLSNPTSRSEAHPEDLLKWSKGQALIATGSPYPPVNYGGRELVIGQCNNVFIFPGVGLGVIATKAKRVTDQMFLEAARVLSDYAPILNDPYASLFPRLSQLRTISRDVALAVAKEAARERLSALSIHEVESAVERAVWEPRYPAFKKV